MNKAILFFSGGKDSSMSLQWLADRGYATTIVTIDNHPSNLVGSDDVRYIVDSFKHVLYDHLDMRVLHVRPNVPYGDDLYDVLKDLCVSDTVLCSGEADQLSELYEYAHIAQRLSAKGLLAPYVAMPKADFLTELQSTNFEYVITGGFISRRGYVEDVQGLVGRRVSAHELTDIYHSLPEVFSTMQTLLVRGGFANPAVTDEQIDAFCTALYQQRSKSVLQLLD